MNVQYLDKWVIARKIKKKHSLNASHSTPSESDTFFFNFSIFKDEMLHTMYITEVTDQNTVLGQNVAVFNVPAFFKPHNF